MQVGLDAITSHIPGRKRFYGGTIKVDELTMASIELDGIFFLAAWVRGTCRLIQSETTDPGDIFVDVAVRIGPTCRQISGEIFRVYSVIILDVITENYSHFLQEPFAVVRVLGAGRNWNLFHSSPPLVDFDPSGHLLS